MTKAASSTEIIVRRNNDASEIKRNNDDGNHLQSIESLSSVIPSITTAALDSYLNKIVIVIGGSSVGLKGKVTNIAHRGWWTIDNPKLVGKKVTGKLCRLVSSMPASHVEQYEAMVGTLQGNQYGRIDLDDGKTNANQEIYNFNNRRGSLRKKRSKRAKPYKESYSSAKRNKLRGHCSQDQASITFPFLSNDNITLTSRILSTASMHEAKNIESNILFPSEKVSLQHRKPKHLPLLRPVLLDSSDNHKCFQPSETLRHLQPDLVIDIFNRKTGRIMRGENGIKVKELAPILRSHAEYEPLIPPPLQGHHSNTNIDACKVETVCNKNSQHYSRMARSSNNTRVNANVQPQVRAHTSILKGSDVIVMDGPSRGLIGKVVTYISGNWCMVSDLIDNDGKTPDVVVHATKLKVLPLMSEIKIEHQVGGCSQVSRFSNKNMMNESNDEMRNITDWQKNQVESVCSRICALQDKKAKLKKGTLERSSNLALSRKFLGLDQTLPSVQIETRRVSNVITNAQITLNHQQIVEQMLGVS